MAAGPVQDWIGFFLGAEPFFCRGVTKKKDLVTARSEATKQSLRNAPQMRDCFARRGLAMTFDFLLVTPPTEVLGVDSGSFARAMR